MNAHRASLGLGSLSISPALTASALWKSRHMAYLGYFAHDDPAPPLARTFEVRIAQCGYPSGGLAENIGRGYPSPGAVMEGWLNSPGHRTNIENPDYRAIGVGAASGGELLWTQTFGTEPDPAAASDLRPSAAADRGSVLEDSFIELPVLANDRDDAPAWMHVVSVGSPKHGRAEISQAGAAVLVRPAPNFNGQDTFRYSISDLTGQTSTAEVSMTVTPVNDKPIARRDRVRVRSGRRVTARVLRNDRDLDGDRLRIKKIVTKPRFGRAGIRRGQVIRYRPRRGFVRRDRLTYRVVDPSGAGARARLSIRVRRAGWADAAPPRRLTWTSGPASGSAGLQAG